MWARTTKLGGLRAWRDAIEAALDVEARGHDFSMASSRDGALGRRAPAAAVTSRPSRSSPHDVAAAVCGGLAFKREERRDSQTDEVVVGRADRERKGRSDKNGAAGNGRAVHVGSKEDVGGLSPPTDAVYGLALRGNLLVSGEGHISSGVRMWKVSERACYATHLGHKGDVMSVAISDRETGVAMSAASQDAIVRVWPLDKHDKRNTCVAMLKHPSFVCSVAMHGDDRAARQRGGLRLGVRRVLRRFAARRRRRLRWRGRRPRRRRAHHARAHVARRGRVMDEKRNGGEDRRARCNGDGTSRPAPAHHHHCVTMPLVMKS